MMTLFEDIETEAANLGFFLIGGTKPHPPAHFERFREWLQKGFHAEMHYLEDNSSLAKRYDPRLLFPETNTILSLAFPYPIPPQSLLQNDDSLTGWISSYALGEDYHRWIPRLLSPFLQKLSEMTGKPITSKVLVDSAPFLERDFAASCGLGWIGKNSCIIHPTHGSCFFLCEILLDINLNSTHSPQGDFCGNCDACITACPTQCIQPDRTIDSSRCISYLTIENRSYIPRELREKMGAWIFGCDVCQMVCPWNIHAARGQANRRVENSNMCISLVDESRLTSRSFFDKYAVSPIRRAKHSGYLRNIAVALGNSRQPEAVTPLTELLSPPSDALVRSHAAWALGRIASHQAKNILKKAALEECNLHVKDEIDHALIESS